MLKKSGIKNGDAMGYLAFIIRIVHVCVEKQSAVKRRNAIGGKEEEPALIVRSQLNEYSTLSTPLLPTSLSPLIYFHISS